MGIFSFHLVGASPVATVRAMVCPPGRGRVNGLRHVECMTTMKLGAPVLSPERMQLRSLAVFASWESAEALEEFMATTELGRRLAGGWHVRLEFLRRWGHLAELGALPAGRSDTDPESPVVAVTVARLRLPEVCRFIRWGRPVEELVRDHPGTTLALAAMRPPNTFCTFTIWRAERDMTDMVHGRGESTGADRHAKAMRERNRRDFHYEFTTLRFRALSEHGSWSGRSDYVPSRPACEPENART